MDVRSLKSKNKRMASHLICLFPNGRYDIGSRSREHKTLFVTTPMPNKRPMMNLFHDEKVFLRRWMYDEVHFQDGQGPAKKLQIEHRVLSAELAILIAAAIPDIKEQEAAGSEPSAEALSWPWSEESLGARLAEARIVLAVDSSRMSRPSENRAQNSQR
jgi:hypothetical protein